MDLNTIVANTLSPYAEIRKAGTVLTSIIISSVVFVRVAFLPNILNFLIENLKSRSKVSGSTEIARLSFRNFKACCEC